MSSMLTVAALRAGKHVLCEKPLAMNSRESAELVRIAADSGRAAGVAYNIRFYPLCHEAADRIRAGFLGEVLHVNGAYVQDWLLKDTDFNWRVLAEDGGELRAVADVETHWLDLIQFITGHRIVQVFADLRTVNTTRRVRSPTTPAATTKAFRIRSSNCFAVSTAISRLAISKTRHRFPRSPTATVRSSSVRRSCKAIAHNAGSLLRRPPLEQNSGGCRPWGHFDQGGPGERSG